MTSGRNENFTVASFRSAFGCKDVGGVAQAEPEAIIDICHPIAGFSRERSCDGRQKEYESYKRSRHDPHPVHYKTVVAYAAAMTTAKPTPAADKKAIIIASHAISSHVVLPTMLDPWARSRPSDLRTFNPLSKLQVPSRAAIGGDIDGIRHQIVNGLSGFLVADVEQAAMQIGLLLGDQRVRRNMGRRVRRHFLMTRLLEEWLDLLAGLIVLSPD